MLRRFKKLRARAATSYAPDIPRILRVVPHMAPFAGRLPRLYMKFLVLGAAVAAASGSSSVAKRVSNSVVMVGGLLGLSTVVEYVSSVGTVPVLASGLGAKGGISTGFGLSSWKRFEFEHRGGCLRLRHCLRLTWFQVLWSIW
jgi:hypothetical protein